MSLNQSSGFFDARSPPPEHWRKVSCTFADPAPDLVGTEKTCQVVFEGTSYGSAPDYSVKDGESPVDFFLIDHRDQWYKIFRYTTGELLKLHSSLFASPPKALAKTDPNYEQLSLKSDVFRMSHAAWIYLTDLFTEMTGDDQKQKYIAAYKAANGVGDDDEAKSFLEPDVIRTIARKTASHMVGLSAEKDPGLFEHGIKEPFAFKPAGAPEPIVDFQTGFHVETGSNAQKEFQFKMMTFSTNTDAAHDSVQKLVNALKVGDLFEWYSADDSHTGFGYKFADNQILMEERITTVTLDAKIFDQTQARVQILTTSDAVQTLKAKAFLIVPCQLACSPKLRTKHFAREIVTLILCGALHDSEDFNKVKIQAISDEYRITCALLALWLQVNFHNTGDRKIDSGKAVIKASLFGAFINLRDKARLAPTLKYINGSAGGASSSVWKSATSITEEIKAMSDALNTLEGQKATMDSQTKDLFDSVYEFDLDVGAAPSDPRQLKLTLVDRKSRAAVHHAEAGFTRLGLDSYASHHDRRPRAILDDDGDDYGSLTLDILHHPQSHVKYPSRSIVALQSGEQAHVLFVLPHTGLFFGSKEVKGRGYAPPELLDLATVARTTKNPASGSKSTVYDEMETLSTRCAQSNVRLSAEYKTLLETHHAYPFVRARRTEVKVDTYLLQTWVRWNEIIATHHRVKVVDRAVLMSLFIQVYMKVARDSQVTQAKVVAAAATAAATVAKKHRSVSVFPSDSDVEDVINQSATDEEEEDEDGVTAF